MPIRAAGSKDVEFARGWALDRLQEIVNIWREKGDDLHYLVAIRKMLAKRLLEALEVERQNTMEEVGSWYEPSPPGR
jgi:hypothetical protein